MSMPPRSRTGSGPLARRPDHRRRRGGVDRRARRVRRHAGERLEQLLPEPRAGGVTDRSTSVQNLYDFVFYIAVAIFLARRGPDRVVGLPLPPQVDRHGPPAADPRQQPGRGHLDGHPHRDRHRPVRDVVAVAQHGRRQGAHRRHRPRRRGPVPVVVRLPGRHHGAATRRRCSPWHCRSATTAAWSLPVGEPVHVELRSETSSTRSTSRSSCSSGTSCRAHQHVRLHGRGGGHLPRPVRGAVRRLPRRDAVRRPRRAARRLRRVARGADRQGQRDAAARRRRARPPVRRWPARPAQEHRVRRRPRSRRPPTRRSRSTSTTRTPACRTTSRSRTPAAACRSRATIFTGIAETDYAGRRRSPRAPTSSSARCTRT